MSKREITIRVGHVCSDSGLLLIADPANLNEHWKNIHPSDLDKDKSYFHIPTMKTLEYGKDFINESVIVDEIGCSVKEALLQGDLQPIMQGMDRTFNLRGCIATAHETALKHESDWMLHYPDSGLPGIGVVIAPGQGEGVYPVFAVMEIDDDGTARCKEITIKMS